MSASISPSPLENHGRCSQIRTPLRRIRLTANGCLGSVVCSQRKIGITSHTPATEDADKLVETQYEFIRSVIGSASETLRKQGDAKADAD
jgi:hypothetical protein